jgi:hypothetical protein
VADQLFMNKPLQMELDESPTLTAQTVASGDLALVFDTSADRWKLKALGGGTTNPITTISYEATVTVANGQTTGKESGIAMPANFQPVAMAVHVTVASTNAVTLVDVGDDADTDSYCDGLTTPSLATTGFKGIFGCNGVRGIASADTGVVGGTGTADEVEIVVSGDPGATGVTVRLTFIGFLAAAS